MLSPVLVTNLPFYLHLDLFYLLCNSNVSGTTKTVEEQSLPHRCDINVDLSARKPSCAIESGPMEQGMLGLRRREKKSATPT